MAGQFAIHRSSPFETIDNVVLPSYYGDSINGRKFTAKDRKPDPQRMLEAYHQSSQTLNILRAFSTGGYADISRLHAWNLDFIDQTEEGSKYHTIAEKVEDTLLFMKAIGLDTASSTFTQTSFYTAHECVLLPYEQALTRIDSTTGRWYACSAHLLWIGDIARQFGEAHTEFLQGIGNPIGIKVSDKCSPQEILDILDKVNPNNIPGRVTLMTRMGASKLRDTLPKLIRAVQKEGRSVLWMCDPVHGNTILMNGVKTRRVEDIKEELHAFFDVHELMGSHPGGVHLEMTGKDVTECIGGHVNEVLDLSQNYQTYHDPRLNADQSLEISFLIADRMRRAQGRKPL